MITLMEKNTRNPNPIDLGTTKDANQRTEAETSKDGKKKERNILTSGWITKFRKRPGNEWLEEIDRDFLRDYTNFTGLDEEISYLSHGLHIIMSDGLYLDSNGNSKIRTKTEGKHLDAAEKLYCSVHARYMLTSKGLDKVLRKYNEGFYGTCPRYYCEKTKVLPIGISSTIGEGNVKVYCPSCEDVYHSRMPPGNDTADGACFGPSVPQMFFMAYPALHPSQPTIGHYIPKLFGFKIHGSAQHQHSEDRELRDNLRHKCATKHRSSKKCAKDKLKDDCKENNPSHQNAMDKLPDINGHPPQPKTTRRRRRKRTTEMQ